jgi:hypothetical protein
MASRFSMSAFQSYFFGGKLKSLFELLRQNVSVKTISRIVSAIGVPESGLNHFATFFKTLRDIDKMGRRLCLKAPKL